MQAHTGYRTCIAVSPACPCALQVAILQRFSGTRGFPQLVAHGQLPGSEPAAAAATGGASHYFVITPVGTHLGDDTSTAAVYSALRDVLHAIGALSQQGFVHRWVGWRRR